MIVIFGGSGFIGTALRTEFVKRKVEYMAPTEEQIDLRYEDSKDKIADMVFDGDTIIMIAAYTKEHGEAYQLTDWNVRMAANMVAAIKDKNIAYFIYISSDSVYGRGEIFSGKLMNEDNPISPDELYGYMHATREQVFREYVPENKLTIFRPCAIYGVGDTHNAYGVNRFIREAKNANIITLFGDGEEMRSNVHVDDVASIIATAAIKKIHGVFNINTGVACTFKDVANLIKKNMGKRIKIVSKLRTKLITHRFFDNSKLVQTFFAPRISDIGIPQMIKQMEN
jgi:UDP-glucose 4-epimerase